MISLANRVAHTGRAALWLALWLIATNASAQAVPVTLKRSGQVWTLTRDGRPYEVKGVAGDGSLELARRIGANSVRTWDAEHAQAILDDAQRHGITVMLGLWLVPQRDGFDYGNAAVVAAQFDRLKAQIDRCKDHPALLAWGIGNELDLKSTDARVWDAVEALAKYAHRVDPHHPVATITAGLHAEHVAAIVQRVPDLDIYAVNAYGTIARVREELDRFGWHSAYLIAEWGVDGPWESPLTSWGVALEPTSSQKRATIAQRYAHDIAANRERCLGSYAFLWGAKQEYTATWFGLLAADGTPTEIVDALELAFNGRAPRAPAAAIARIAIDGRGTRENIRLAAGKKYTAEVVATLHSSPSQARRGNDVPALAYAWKLVEESQDKRIGGAREAAPADVAISIEHAQSSRIVFETPQRRGAYRLCVEVRANGKLSYANVPLLVE